MSSLFLSSTGTCSDACGWAAALICVVSFGSFGVPIKKCGVSNVHPLVLQSYKTMVCFLTSWVVVFFGIRPRWTPWGLVSGLFWVPGAACGIYGIRNAGLAVAVGTWSAIIVLTSFLFGFWFFQEPVHNQGETVGAFVLITTGLVGMSKYSAPPPTVSSSSSSSTMSLAATMASPSSTPGKLLRKAQSSFTNDDTRSNSPTTSQQQQQQTLYSSSGSMSNVGGMLEMEPVGSDHSTEDAIMKGHLLGDSSNDDTSDKDPNAKDRVVVLFGGKWSVTKRQLGILAAVINGAWGGLNLVPLHFARREGFAGATYLISYGTGALIVNIVLWVALLAYHLWRCHGQWQDAVDCLPAWHWKQLWMPGGLAGLLYSIGNFSAILAVTYLGQGTGYSFCQMQLLVSGLWGVLYFDEIKGRNVIWWFASAVTAVLGIVWLSHNHVSAAGGH